MAKESKKAAPATAKVQAAPSLAGKTVNLPHSEHAAKHRTNHVTFGPDGVAEVHPDVADALVEFYGSQLRKV